MDVARIYTLQQKSSLYEKGQSYETFDKNKQVFLREMRIIKYNDIYKFSTL